MNNSWKIKLAAVGCGMLLCTGAAASESLLASTELQQEQGKATAELWGERLSGGYTEELLLLLKDGDGKIVTAYKPSVKGGYNPVLQAVQVKPVPKAAREDCPMPQQALLSLGLGAWDAGSEHRIIDFANPKQVTELFDAADNMGIVTSVYNKERSLQITLQDGQQNEAPLPEGLPQTGRIDFGGLFSLTAYDLDGDGQQELLSSQQLTRRRQLLADVGAVWRLQRDKDKSRWQRSSFTVMTAAPTDKQNTINDGCDFATGSILPRKMVVPGGEATYPVFASQDARLQNKINDYLQKECADYLQSFYRGQADMAFKILRADELLLSVQLISGKTSFVHHQLHLDPATGEPVKLEQILDTKNPDLRPLLNLLCTNKNMSFTEGLPDEWYLEGGNLFLVQRICGQDEIAGFALGNLHKFLLDKKWLQQTD